MLNTWLTYETKINVKLKVQIKEERFIFMTSKKNAVNGKPPRHRL